MLTKLLTILSSGGGYLEGAALDVVTAMGTAITATISPLAAAPGDSLAVKNSPLDAQSKIHTFWGDVQVAGTGRIRSARLHDNVQGMRFDTIIGDLKPYMPWGVAQRVYANDVLSIELAGSAVAGDIESISLLLYYPDLPGIAARFIGPDELKSKGGNITMVENTIATGTAGGYSGGEAINVEQDQFHAGRQYALVGYLCDTETTTIAWRGPDTGNLRVGGPGEETEREMTADWFRRLSAAFGLPLIPVISAENKAATLIDAVQDENGADPTITSIFVELS
jgi:hypothetical protein